ncbi:MAG: glycosyltransferase, partial [Solirubrobacterales bacterium]|nr:glycosyltransferase [Solirubrobacterales bacterium]
MRPLQPVQIEAMDPRRFEPLISSGDYQDLLALIGRASALLHGRVIWNVNSTAAGGGVAELLRTLLGYSRGGGVDARWLVISGGPAFFEVTKRIHTHLHGFDADGRGLGEPERAIYEGTLAENAAELVPMVHPEDIVILHDPQTAGLVDALGRTGAAVIWRCHVGADNPNAYVHEAWSFLRRYVRNADAYVFSRAQFAWDGLDPRKIAVIHPSIDPFSAKNQDQTPAQTLAILRRAGILRDGGAEHGTFTHGDSTPGRIDRPATLLEAEPLAPGDRFIVQVSRWDGLKDPLGVIAGYARYIANRTDAHLVLGGPAADSVADDPEGAAVIGLVRDAWHRLPDAIQSRVHVASLPMTDVGENAAIVNALQRRAAVVVQKSIAEGFGLTVAEAMWKERAVVAGAVGGIQDQIVDGQSGVLLSDPHDLESFGMAVVDLLEDRELAERIGVAAHVRIRNEFLAPRHLGRHFELIERVLSERDRKRRMTVWAPT